jgi:hypothetical protein
VLAAGELPGLAGLVPELVPEQAARPGTAAAAMAQAAIRPGFMVSPHVARLGRGCATGLELPWNGAETRSAQGLKRSCSHNLRHGSLGAV